MLKHSIVIDGALILEAVVQLVAAALNYDDDVIVDFN